MMNEPEVVKDWVRNLMGAPFEIDEAPASRLRLREQAMWLVRCRDLVYHRQVGSLEAAWKHKDGTIWLETAEIADMIELVEREYGEKGIHIMPDAEKGVAPKEGIPDEVAKFPKVVDMLKASETVVARSSKATGVHLEILYDGGSGVTTFRIGARIDSPPKEPEALRRQIADTAMVLRDVYNEVRPIVWP